MTTLIVIIAVLFLALIIIVPLLEKHAGKGDAMNDSRMTRWIIPLMAVILVLAVARHYMG